MSDSLHQNTGDSGTPLERTDHTADEVETFMKAEGWPPELIERCRKDLQFVADATNKYAKQKNDGRETT